MPTGTGTPHRVARRVRRILLYGVTAALLLVFLTPFEWMAATAFKQNEEIFAFPPSVIPESPTLQNFQRALVVMEVGFRRASRVVRERHVSRAPSAGEPRRRTPGTSRDRHASRAAHR